MNRGRSRIEMGGFLSTFMVGVRQLTTSNGIRGRMRNEMGGFLTPFMPQATTAAAGVAYLPMIAIGDTMEF